MLQVETPRYESTKDLNESNATMVVHVQEENNVGRTVRLTVQKQGCRIRLSGFEMTYRIARIEPAGP